MESGQGSFPSPGEIPEEENVEEVEGEIVPSEPDFETQVLQVMHLMETDPKNRDRVLAEVYVFISGFERNLRIMQTSMMNIGPREMFKMMFKKDKGGKDGE